MKSGRLAGENGASILLPEVKRGTLPRQIITLAYLSEQIPHALVSEQLARSLCVEAEATVVLVRLEPQDHCGHTGAQPQPDFYLNGEFHMPLEMERTDSGFCRFTLGVRTDPPTPAGI